MKKKERKERKNTKLELEIVELEQKVAPSVICWNDCEVCTTGSEC